MTIIVCPLSRVPDIAKQVDILLGNLEDAIPTERKLDAREGLIKIAREVDFGETQLWTRINSLDSPWMLDDLVRLVGEIGDKLDVIMVPKVEGAWDIHYVDQLLAQLEEANTDLLQGCCCRSEQRHRVRIIAALRFAIGRQAD